MFLHYIHLNKKWYYFFNEYESKKTWRPCQADGIVRNDLFYFAGEGVTKLKARKILKDMFPDYSPILTYPYHEGPKRKRGRRK